MPRERELPTDRPRHIFIIGQSGSGKSTLAHRLSAALNIRVTDLDLVFRDGGGNGPLRSTADRDADLADLTALPTWIAEGIHLDGTTEVMNSADLIVWLDQDSGWSASVRIVRRFIAGAWYEVRHQRGWRRFFRFGDYVRHLRDLSRAIPESRAYSSGGDRAPVTRAQVAQRLAAYGDKVVRCTSDDDVETIVSQLKASARVS